MKKSLAKLHRAVLVYARWGWPFVLTAMGLDTWLGDSDALWRSWIDNAAFAWFLCAPAYPLTLLLDRTRRETAMAALCGLREGDERERAVTGEAARATLLLALALQTILLAMSLTMVRLFWDPLATKKNERGLITVGFSFDFDRHMDPFGAAPPSERSVAALGAALSPGKGQIEFGGFLLSPSSFPLLSLMILVELAAFKAFSRRRYEGLE